MSIFSGLITSKTRVQLLMRLFLNPAQEAYIRELSKDFNVSPSLVKGELNQLSRTGLVTSRRDGRQVNYRANLDHPLFPELHSMVRKALGMDSILASIVERLGNVDLALLLGDYASGKDSGIIDLALVGSINKTNLQDLVEKTERYIGRKIRVLVLTHEEYESLTNQLDSQPKFILWSSLGERNTRQPQSS